MPEHKQQQPTTQNSLTQRLRELRGYIFINETPIFHVNQSVEAAEVDNLTQLNGCTKILFVSVSSTKSAS
jgi:hypothetical protein